ncbi:class I SAM-dependent methyltransferase [Streptomyces sp. AJS327]|uniref:methyltransferase n=1 Tax=Streptomyces sp. AJS327 TaxID=2545265 RepID=UPI0015DFC3D7|nr:class I SAM-dependent methyltransferase [Streptomyces sp. AJS327]MBA0051528.1 class I SAM-dependent methyltransferase [Streptomyces sp. AJS327]
MSTFPVVRWIEDGEERTAAWRSESGARPPRRIVVADDRTRADEAYKLACEGTALLWRGDFHGARQLLSALGRRVDRKPAKRGASPRESFHRYRQARSRRARVLGMLLVPLETGPTGYTVPLRRAPAVDAACAAAFGSAPGPGPGGEPAPESAPEPGLSLLALRELLGATGAYEWQRTGVPVAALDGERVHPRYGVFSPVRGEYVDLVARVPLPPGGTARAVDVGTGSGVLAVVLARRGVAEVVATDQDARALECARENARRLGVADAVRVVEADLFPDTRPSPLVVCNPPWVPATPTAPLEHAVYDPGSRMLRGFLSGLAARVTPDGEGWLVLSDLAERLELRSRAELLEWIGQAGLRVLGREDTRPRHPRAARAEDVLAVARTAEVTSLWRLGRAD